MTSPLVKPACGYITLSRLDSSRSRPSISTANRELAFDTGFPPPVGSGAIVILLHAFRGRLVRAQPQKSREPQPAVRGPVAVANLDHQLRAYPVRAPGILAGHRP